MLFGYRSLLHHSPGPIPSRPSSRPLHMVPSKPGTLHHRHPQRVRRRPLSHLFVPFLFFKKQNHTNTRTCTHSHEQNWVASGSFGQTIKLPSCVHHILSARQSPAFPRQFHAFSRDCRTPSHATITHFPARRSHAENRWVMDNDGRRMTTDVM